MDILSAVVAGIIQGLTEFLPVSSSGHLALYHAFFGSSPVGSRAAFDAFLHLGTLIAVCAVCRKDVFGIAAGCFTGVRKIVCGKARQGFSTYERLAFFTLIATLPLVLLALAGADGAAEAMSLHPVLVGAALICNGFIILFSEKTGKSDKNLSEMNAMTAVITGLCQGIAIVPGLSRSGCTVSGGLLCGLDRESAVRFSFLISVPAIIGANVLKLPEVITSGSLHTDAAAYICGFAAAAISGFCAIRLFLFTAKKAKLRYFSLYCFALGVIAVVNEIISLT